MGSIIVKRLSKIPVKASMRTLKQSNAKEQKNREKRNNLRKGASA